MNCKIIVVDTFRKDAKRLLKKYTSLKTELIELQKQLLENPRMGTMIAPNTYKIRLSVKSKGKGKSGGLRVISFVIDMLLDEQQEKGFNIYLLTIYNKSEQANINNSMLKSIISQINAELE